MRYVTAFKDGKGPWRTEGMDLNKGKGAASPLCERLGIGAASVGVVE